METESEAGIVERNVEKRSDWRMMKHFAGFIFLPTLYKNIIHDPDNHDGVITHLQPDILEYEVKWALESITTNKASGDDGIPVELF